MLPVEISVGSALNAVAHCVDTLWGSGADPINTPAAPEADARIAAALGTDTALEALGNLDSTWIDQSELDQRVLEVPERVR